MHGPKSWPTKKDVFNVYLNFRDQFQLLFSRAELMYDDESSQFELLKNERTKNNNKKQKTRKNMKNNIKYQKNIKKC